VVNRVQTLRSSTAGSRPTGRSPGELYVNFPDNALGVANAAGTSFDLLAVRFHSTLASYAIGDYVVSGGVLYRATASSVPGAFTPANWSKVMAQADLTAAYLPLTGGSLTGNLSIAPAAGGAAVNVNPTAASQQALVNFYGSGAAKWQVGKQTDDSFLIYDTVAPSGVITIASNGTTVNFSRQILLPANPSAALGAATKQYVDTADALKANLASPVFTGDPTAPTPATADNDTSIATTAYVKAQGYATLASPVFTGNPTAPTPTAGDNDTSIATTAFVTTALAAAVVVKTRTFSSLTPSAYTPTAGTAYVTFECVGGGGGGGGTGTANASTKQAAGGGAGGSYSKTTVAVATATGLTMTVGAAGAAANPGPNAGGAGGTTSVGTICTAPGGGGGGSAAIGVAGQPGASGGTGTGDVIIAGGAGGYGLYAPTITYSFTGGAGGNAGGGFGMGYQGFMGGTGVGGAGTAWGGGGGGGISSNATSNAGGGAGAQGVIVITEYIH